MTRPLNQSDAKLIRSVKDDKRFLLGSAPKTPSAGSFTGRQSSRLCEALSSRPTSPAADQVVIVSTGLGTDPSDICRPSREPASARGSAMCRTQPILKSPSFLPSIASCRRCSTRFAQSMPSFCVAGRISTRWIRLSQLSILPRRLSSSPT
jgi:hypothetical protein